MKKILIPIISSIILTSMFAAPVLADSTAAISYFVLPIKSGWKLLSIRDTSYGGFLGIQLSANNGNNNLHTIQFVGLANNDSQITNIATVQEGGNSVSYASYNDNNNSTGRYLKGVNMRNYKYDANNTLTITGVVVY